MCGIAGIVSSRVAPPRLRAVLDRMLAAIRHRGPDDLGTYCRGGHVLGMRRLSIIDIHGGRQPMVSADEMTVLVFNGEVYNARDLRTELTNKGHLFRTRCDTEVILHGYRQWGERVVEHLDGMFAFAVYDLHDGSLFLARDHFGIKPLYCLAKRSLFAFCSEPLPLLDVPGVSRQLDPHSLWSFLAYKYVAGSATFVEGITKLEPGTHIRVDGDGNLVRRRRYWQLRVDRRDGTNGDRLRELLVAAVEKQLVSDVPLGVFLSGGIDSGLLLWAGSQARPAAPPEAYTVGFDDCCFDESNRASKTAGHFNVKHHIERQPFPSSADLADMVTSFGEPFANISVPANFVMSKAASRHVKVVLNGSGADELFGGYDRYYAIWPPRLLSMARSWSSLLLPLARMIGVGRGKRSLITRARRFLETSGAPPAEAHADAIRLFTADEMRELTPDLEVGDDPILSKYAEAPPGDDLVRAMWVDAATMLADDYLTLIDRTSMSASLEVRVPFLDLELATYAFSLDSAARIKGWEKKRILRRLAAECLPREIAKGPKQGLESPVGAWFRGSLGNEMIASLRDSQLRSLVNPDYVERLLDRHRAHRHDASKQLLGIHTLCLWVEANSITV